MLNWLTENTTRELLNSHIDPRSPAGYERAKRVLSGFLQEKHRSEPMVPEWKFPMNLEVDMASPVPRLQLSILREWEAENILYLDFDDPSLFPKTERDPD